MVNHDPELIRTASPGDTVTLSRPPLTVNVTMENANPAKMAKLAELGVVDGVIPITPVHTSDFKIFIKGVGKKDSASSTMESSSGRRRLCDLS